MRIKMINNSFLILLTAIVTFHPFDIICQTGSFDTPSHEPGKCFANCLIPNIIEKWKESFPVFLGEYSDTLEYVQLISIELPQSNIWEKKRDANCKSSNPEDCFIWCLYDQPSTTLELYVVSDTSLTTNYVWESFDLSEVTIEGGYFELKQVICAAKINDTILQRISTELFNQGFLGRANLGFTRSKIKGALKNFQIKNNLPLGEYDFETLEALGIILE